MQANGYGLVRFSDRFRSGENETIKIETGPELGLLGVGRHGDWRRR